MKNCIKQVGIIFSALTFGQYCGIVKAVEVPNTLLNENTFIIVTKGPKNLSQENLKKFNANKLSGLDDQTDLYWMSLKDFDCNKVKENLQGMLSGGKRGAVKATKIVE